MASWFRPKPKNTALKAEADDATNEDVSVDEFRPPADTLGLRILYEPATGPVLADVVAVHGLGGDSLSTWTSKGHSKTWLEEFLSKEQYFSQARIMTFGYDGRAWFTAAKASSSKRTFVFAECLLVDLENKRILTDTVGRPIIFLGHSLGGIVIKKAIITAHESRLETHELGGRFWDIYQSTKAFVFFGTPHQGSDAAVWANYLGAVAKTVGLAEPSPATIELQTWSPALTEVAIYSSTHICRPGMHLVTFFETQPYHGVQVVNEASATMNYPQEVRVGLNENHRTICKFSSTESASYKTVADTMKMVAKRIKESAEKASEKEKDMKKDEKKEKEPNMSLPAAPTSDPVAQSASKLDLEERFKNLTRSVTRRDSGLGD